MRFRYRKKSQSHAHKILEFRGAVKSLPCRRVSFWAQYSCLVISDVCLLLLLASTVLISCLLERRPKRNRREPRSRDYDAVVSSHFSTGNAGENELGPKWSLREVDHFVKGEMWLV